MVRDGNLGCGSILTRTIYGYVAARSTDDSVNSSHNYGCHRQRSTRPDRVQHQELMEGRELLVPVPNSIFDYRNRY
jgi:hypothetical protein